MTLQNVDSLRKTPGGFGVVVRGVLIIKEMFDLTDEASVDNFEFNASWQEVLNVGREIVWMVGLTVWPLTLTVCLVGLTASSL